MKEQKSGRRQVCMLCGKPSKQSICDACKAKVHGETLRRKTHTEKSRK